MRSTQSGRAALVRSTIIVLSIVVAAAGFAAAECDLMGPMIGGVTLSPAAVNVTAGPADVTCTMTFTDSPAGVESATCTIQSPVPLPPEFPQLLSCTADTPISGTPHDGTWRCTITVPRYSRSGMWSLASATATDTVGNQGFFPPPPAFVTVTSTPDTVNPGLTTWNRTPASVNVTSAPQNVTCTFTATDNLAGVEFIACGFTSPDLPSGDVHATGCIDDAPNTGTRQNGTFSCVAQVPRYAQAGTWKASIQIRDAVGNFTFLTDADLAGRGLPSTLTVTDTTPDLAAPILDNFDFQPRSVDPQGQAQTVRCTFQLRDTPAGVATASCSFSSPFFGQDAGCSADTPVSGTPQNGTYQCDAIVPRYAEGGAWRASVSASDALGNQLSLIDTDLAGRGLPSLLDVVCGQGGGEANLFFGDATTLQWNAVAGAVEYFVYRGLTSSLTDFDFDGLADGGYGACQNARDADTTDTVFIEPDRPAAGAAFFFLVAFDDGTGEQGLGNSSSGLPRFPTMPCF